MTIPQALVKKAIVGTSRPQTDENTANAILSSQLSSYDPEAQLLLQVAAYALQRDMQPTPLPDNLDAIEPAEPEVLERCNPNAIHYLDLMLSGLYHDLLPEWFREVSNANRRVPEESLYRLHKLSSKDPALSKAVAPVMGNRGQWLAKQIGEQSVQPSRFASRQKTDVNTIVDRIQQVLESEEKNVSKRRESIAGICENINEYTRQQLEELDIALDGLFNTFLWEALEIRRFRMWSAQSLVTLSLSDFVQDMEDAATRFVVLRRVGRRQRYSIDFNWAGAVTRADKNQKRFASANDFVVRDVQWEPEEILALVRPTFWCSYWQIKPDDLIEAGRNSEHTHVFFNTWIDATLQFEDVEFAEALLAHVRLHDLRYDSRQQLAGLLSGEQRERVAMLWLNRGGTSFDDHHPSVPLLKAHQETWSEPLMGAFLEALERSFQNMKRPLLSPIRHLLRALTPYFPVTLKDELQRVLQLGQHNELNDNELKIINEFIGLINFRMEMVDAIRN